MRKDRGQKKSAWIFGVCAAGGALSLVMGDYLCRYAVDRNYKKGASSAEEHKDALRQWLYQSADDIYLRSFDGLLLHAHYLPAKEMINHRFVIICHGYKCKASDMAGAAKHFWNQGYHVLCPDARGHGSSEGGYIGMGWTERRDLLKWIRYLLRKDEEASIALYGVSMGAATVMMASGERLPDGVKAIVEDCGYTSAWEEFRYQLGQSFHLPAFPFLYTASLISRLRYGYGFREASARRQVGKNKVPMLMIHGDADDFVPFAMLDKLWRSATGKKEKLVIRGAGHAKSEQTAPQQYWDTIDAFLERYL